MHSTTSTVSTESPDDFFAGALRKISTNEWDRIQWPDVFIQTSGNEPQALFAWGGHMGINRFAHIVAVNGDVMEGADWYNSILPRIVCHITVDRVPEQGLNELSTRITEIHDFYTAPAEVPALPMLEPVAGRIVRSEVRPVFTIDEE